VRIGIVIDMVARCCARFARRTMILEEASPSNVNNMPIPTVIPVARGT